MSHDLIINRPAVGNTCLDPRPAEYPRRLRSPSA
jgi:hypothetical protein